jgi:hypothetical protein
MIDSGKVVKAFDEYLAKVDGVVTSFETLEAATEAVVVEEQAEDFAARALAYCEARGYEGKNIKTKTNQVMDFMAYEASLINKDEE